MSTPRSRRLLPVAGLMLAGALLLPAPSGDAAPYQGGTFALLQASQGGGAIATSTSDPIAIQGISGGEGGGPLSGGDFSLRPGVRGPLASPGASGWVIH